MNLSAPRLFSDELYLEYMLHTLQMEFFNYNQSILTSVKTPVQKFYEEIMKDTINLEMETNELCKQKGLYLRAPHVPPIKTVEYVKRNHSLQGGLVIEDRFWQQRFHTLSLMRSAMHWARQ